MGSTINFTFFVKLLIMSSCIKFILGSDFEATPRGTNERAIGKPHIILIVADDAGFNDFSFHGSPQIPTPNIDSIALNGIILNQYYSAPLCTPSRGATLTGKYPIHIGLPHGVIIAGQPSGLPLQKKLLPQYLKELDYKTHLVGKWHLGHALKAYTPTFRGFDSHYGYYLGVQDYYNHTSEGEIKNTLFEGGTRLAGCMWTPYHPPHVHQHIFHSTDWLPTLLEAAGGNLDFLEGIDGVSQWKSLMELEEPPRTEFLYNIGDAPNYNNSGVRFGKWKLVQGNACPLDKDDRPMAAEDGQPACDYWFGPSGRDPIEDNCLDTCPVESLLTNYKSVEDLIPIILDSEAGRAFEEAGFPIDKENAIEIQKPADLGSKCDESVVEIPCDTMISLCLFNIEEDPCERRNLAEVEPDMVEFLRDLIRQYNETAIPPIVRMEDPNSDPDKWGGIWTFWLDSFLKRSDGI